MKRVVGQCTPGSIRELIQLVGEGRIKAGDNVKEMDIPPQVKHALTVLVHMLKVNDNDLDKVLADLAPVKQILLWERDDGSHVAEFKLDPDKLQEEARNRGYQAKRMR